MCNRFEVWVWHYVDDAHGYRDEEFWRGQGVVGAILALIRAKRNGYGCVTLRWR